MHVQQHFPSKKSDGSFGWYEISPYRSVNLPKVDNYPQQFDYAIIGAGYTGVATARRLAEINPDAKILLLDALKVGEGSSGRNAGFLIDVPHALDKQVEQTDYNQRTYQLNQFAIQQLKSAVDQYRINCDWKPSGKYLAGHEMKNISRLDQFSAMLSNNHLSYEEYGQNDLCKLLGTSYYQKGIYTPGAVLVNPASLIRGLALNLPRNITLFEETPLIHVQYGEAYHQLRTKYGDFSAKIIIHTRGGYNMTIGQNHRYLVPCFTYASLTAPLSDEQIETYFKQINPWGVTSAHPAGSTVRFTEDCRLFIRNKFDYNSKMYSDEQTLALAKSLHIKSFKARFPMLGEPNFEHTWGGVITVTRELKSIFKEEQPRCYSVTGCNGVGVVKGTYLGYYMADYIHGIRSDHLSFILEDQVTRQLPPQILTKIGATIRFWYEENQAQGDI